MHTLRQLSQSVLYVSKKASQLKYRHLSHQELWIEKYTLNKDANKILRGKNVLEYRHVSVIISVKNNNTRFA